MDMMFQAFPLRVLFHYVRENGSSIFSSPHNQKVHVHVGFGPSQLSCLGSSVGRALCIECRVSWVRVPPEAAQFFLGKMTALGVLCCFALFVCLTLLASFFLPSHLSFKNMYILDTYYYSTVATHRHMMKPASL